MFQELEDKINRIDDISTRGQEKAAAAVELLHDVKYELNKTKQEVQMNGNWIFVLIIGLIVSCVMSGCAIYKIDKAREEIGRAVQREDERPSGAGSKDSSGHREVPKIP